MKNALCISIRKGRAFLWNLRTQSTAEILPIWQVCCIWLKITSHEMVVGKAHQSGWMQYSIVTTLWIKISSPVEKKRKKKDLLSPQLCYFRGSWESYSIHGIKMNPVMNPKSLVLDKTRCNTPWTQSDALSLLWLSVSAIYSLCVM